MDDNVLSPIYIYKYKCNSEEYSAEFSFSPFYFIYGEVSCARTIFFFGEKVRGQKKEVSPLLVIVLSIFSVTE